MFLITGGFGYIGTQLLEILPKKYPNERIRVIDNLSRERSKYLPETRTIRGDQFEFVNGDITDSKALEKAFRDLEKESILIDLAGVTNAPISFKRKELTFDVNVGGVKKLTELSKEHGVGTYIYSSSASVYGPTKGVVDEGSTCNPISPYGESKLQAEKVLLSGDKGFDTVVFRSGTVYGWTDGVRFDTVVNKFALDSFEGRPMEVWRSAWDQKRPYLHINDCLGAFIFAIENSSSMSGQVFNVVGQNAPVDDVVISMARNFELTSIKTIEDPNLNQVSYTVDDAKIRNIGFQTNGFLDQGARELASNLSLHRSRLTEKVKTLA